MADHHGPTSRQSTRHPTGPTSPMNPCRATHWLALHHSSDATASDTRATQADERERRAGMKPGSHYSPSPSAPVEEEPALILTTARPSGLLPSLCGLRGTTGRPTWCAVYRYVHITELMVQQCRWIRHTQK